MAIEIEIKDGVQHGLDNDPNHDPEKGALLGGLGGAAVGAAAGSIAGPVGAVLGTVAGGLLGAGAAGLAVGAIDEVDNDNTVSGIGDGTTSADVNPQASYENEVYDVDAFGLRRDGNLVDDTPGIHPDPRAVKTHDEIEHSAFDAEFGPSDTNRRSGL